MDALSEDLFCKVNLMQVWQVVIRWLEVLCFQLVHLSVYGYIVQAEVFSDQLTVSF